MNFQIRGISERKFAHLFGATEEVLELAGVQRIRVSENLGYPCRVSLRDAEIGECVLLLNYTHHDQDSPYRASHAVFVIENEIERELSINEVPQVLRSRLLSVRAFNEKHDMIAADICEGGDVENMIGALSVIADCRYLHIHNARPGCFAAYFELVK